MARHPNGSRRSPASPSRRAWTLSSSGHPKTASARLKSSPTKSSRQYARPPKKNEHRHRGPCRGGRSLEPPKPQRAARLPFRSLTRGGTVGKKAHQKTARRRVIRLAAGAYLLGKKGPHGILSFFSVGSILSAGSILSIGSAGSVLSI